MTIRHFRIFLAVAASESITRAAQALYVSQPTVSVAIRELEQHYGTRLFERMGRRLKITQAGRALQSYATHIISLYDEAEASFQNPDSHGLLRVGASVTFGSYGMPALAAQFAARFPHIRLEVMVDTTETLEKTLLDNRLDAAVVAGAVHSGFLVLTPLFCERHMALCAPGHPMAGRSVTLAQFMAQPLVLRQRTSGAFGLLSAALAQAGYTPHPAWECASPEAILAAVGRGLGVTVLPQQVARPWLSAGRLAAIHVQGLDVHSTVCLAVHKAKFISPALGHFMQAARETAHALGQNAPAPPGPAPAP